MTSSVANLSCDYCGLPVPGSLWNSREPSPVADASPAYCCYGCQLAHAITQEAGEEGSARWTLTRLGIAIFFAMNVMVCTLALWAYDAGQFDTQAPMAASFAELLRFACMLLSLPVLFLLGKPLIENAAQQLQQRRFSTDLLLLSGVLAAYGYSVVAVWADLGPIYFEVGCMILVLVTLGRWLEATGKLKSTEALDRLQQLLPDVVLRLSEEGQFEEIPRSQVQVGDQLRVRAGERIPCDGHLFSSRSTVDEQLLTGEAWPVEKSRGDVLTGGTINLDGDLLLKVSSPPDAGTLDRLVQAVRLARESQGEYQQLADRYSRSFLPIVVIIAAGVLLFHSLQTGLMAGIMASLSVILISCPCALGLATPMAIWAAIGTAARRGIVYQGGAALERLATIKAIRFDKTGTLTTGTPVIEQVITDPSTRLSQVLQIGNMLAESSSHIFSRCIQKYSTQQLTALTLPEMLLVEMVSHPGAGVSASWSAEPTTVALGNLQLMTQFDFNLSEAMEQALCNIHLAGQPYVLIGWAGHVRGLFVLREELRSHAADVIDECRQRGLDVGILTGDYANSAEKVARILNIPVQAQMTPSLKSEAIRTLQKECGAVALIGDGVNDAPALALADVGISLGCGADVTRESADVCLISDDLSQIPWLLDLSARTITTIRQNLLWAFGYNSVGILLAATGYLHPAFAAIMMVGSSVYVISNSLKLSSEFAIDNNLNAIKLPTVIKQVELASLPVPAEEVLA